ncbi:hypothetical protein SBA5_780023 [Candidatus Sulfotelmatomonas gaucii]|uniref:Uncharacterized protein n=1 Tax=Candidatus Sulfuritelmatomonas gaucii TaxID=2043161 RepID=A0A2N9M4C1_9BACT|nr:hypothetical protein SBA5_780023 [Candidatus Sulfotelmatomonas gaucii]
MPEPSVHRIGRQYPIAFNFDGKFGRREIALRGSNHFRFVLDKARVKFCPFEIDASRPTNQGPLNAS